jgi:predicted TIM-barrel fold metal-dependent hydrolase
MMARADMMLPPAVSGLQRPFADYLRQNVHYTFSAFNFTPLFLDLLSQVGVERILFSADYPWAPMEWARRFLDELPVSAADRERIAHGNAERLLGL